MNDLLFFKDDRNSRFVFDVEIFQHVTNQGYFVFAVDDQRPIKTYKTVSYTREEMAMLRLSGYDIENFFTIVLDETNDFHSINT